MNWLEMYRYLHVLDIAGLIALLIGLMNTFVICWLAWRNPNEKSINTRETEMQANDNNLPHSLRCWDGRRYRNNDSNINLWKSDTDRPKRDRNVQG